MTDFSKVGRQSKRKGKTYERRCAKLLTEFTGVNFRKVPSSGGFNKFGGVTIREELFCGDVISDSPDFNFCIEAKNRSNFSFSSILKNKNTAPFSHWWYQCCSDADSVKLLPMLFFKPDNRSDFVAVNPNDFDSLLLESNSILLNSYKQPVSLKIKDNKKKVIDVTVKLPVPLVIDWKVFTSIYEPEVLFKDVVLRKK